MAERDLDAPLLVDAGGGPVTGLTPREVETYAAGGDAAALGKAVARRQRQLDTAVDSVVVSGAPALQAAVVAAFQGSGVDVPLLLTPQAVSPAFPPALADAGGSLAAPLLTVGLDDGDATALEATDAGRALAAYFSALQLAADEPATKDLFGDRPFAEVAAGADVSSHDAVVAVVRAAAVARSTEPGEGRRGAAGPEAGDRGRPGRTGARLRGHRGGARRRGRAPRVHVGVARGAARGGGTVAVLVRERRLLIRFLSHPTRTVLRVGAATTEETPCTW